MLDVSYPVAQRRLDNGLRVIASHDPAAPGVAVNLWDTVGSADDPVGASGFAHLFEHLMFAGSSGVAPGEHLALVQSLGGEANATTSFDRTNYFETVPAHAAELAFWLEADRLRSLDVSQASLDTQRDVVGQEKRQRYDNVPYGDQVELLLALTFPPGHPYAIPPIGRLDDLARASLEQVQAFHAAWYRPEWISLAVAGPLPDDEVFALAERHFGALAPAAQVPAGQPTQPGPLAPHTGLPRLEVERPVPASTLHLCWRTPPFGHRDEEAVSLALDVLATGQSCRLHRALVRGQEAAEAVGALEFGLARGSSLGAVVLRARQGASLAALEEAVVDAVARLAADGPTAAELDRAQAGAERDWFQHLASVDSRADELNGHAVLLGDPGLVNTRLARLRAVTPDDVAQAAATWLAPPARAVLAYRAAEGGR